MSQLSSGWGSVNEIHSALELARQAVEEAHHMSNQLSLTSEKMMAAVTGFTLPEVSSAQRLLPILQ
ncbi:hypothetical protein QEN58_09520 [Halomonas alkaliantarctica]|uniref:Methyl-accepting chemotaxis protein n=1 Tax=Halomonas alkaliantarctica TaxID=232346 RepID=A0ABY8LS83_9GAMM|nr:hypothetical protein [Halomonas alkaliantarctica]WGI27283.1 hypothetical protein QEN58_09520 [Halomonas alkaliantarctica]